jgi:hypothetical protein
MTDPNGRRLGRHKKRLLDEAETEDDDEEQFHILAALTPHSAPASTEQTQGGLQSPSGRYGKEEVPIVPGDKLRFPDLPTCSYKLAYVTQ